MLKNNFGSFLTQFAKISSIYCKMNLLTGITNGGPNFPELRLIFSFHKTSPRPHYVKLTYFVEIIYFSKNICIQSCFSWMMIPKGDVTKSLKLASSAPLLFFNDKVTPKRAYFTLVAEYCTSPLAGHSFVLGNLIYCGCPVM